MSQKTPAATVPQMRAILARLLRHPAPTARQIAQEVSDVLLRNEQARIYHWHARTGRFPPRLHPGGSG
jgi:hypothetical protein